MKCQFCSAPLLKNCPICNYCGQRNTFTIEKKALEEIAIPTKESFVCPVCSSSLFAVNIMRKGTSIVRHCEYCRGVFLSQDNLEKLIEHYIEKKSTIDTKALQLILKKPQTQEKFVIRYRSCIYCHTTMQRLNYKAISGVIVDKCHKHGFWLDGGELKQIFDWKAGQSQDNALEPITTNHKIYKKKPPLFHFDPIGDFFEWLQGG